MYDEYINNKVKKHYDYLVSLGLNVIGVFAQGSMNYGLFIDEEEYKSDVDTKAIVLPTLDDLISGSKMKSTKYDLDGEQIDVKDIRVIMEMWKKQNQSYIEILFTKYKLINPKYKSYVNEIIAMRDDITQMNIPQLARCISGMSKEKICALEHEYPATIEKIKKFGYDPKQLASIIRLTHLIENLFEKNKKFGDAIIYHNGELRNYMIDVKKGKIELEEARKLAELYDTKTNAIKNDVVEQYGKDNFNSEICDKLEIVIYELVKFGIISGVIEARQNTLKKLCDMMVPNNCDDAADKVIK